MTVDVQLSEESKTVLLVGGAGYVGCVLAQELLIRGHTVRVYDRFFYCILLQD